MLNTLKIGIIELALLFLPCAAMSADMVHGGSAGIIAIGTPIFAIVLWRNRGKFLLNTRPGINAKDDLVGAVTDIRPKSSRPY
jgi:hypothetical protein